MQLIRIRELRKQHLYTQKQLADILNTSQSQISKYETDSSSLSADVLIDYARHFNVSVDYILELTDIKNLGFFEKTNENITKVNEYFNRLSAEDQDYVLGKMVELYKINGKKNNVKKDIG